MRRRRFLRVLGVLFLVSLLLITLSTAIVLFTLPELRSYLSLVPFYSPHLATVPLETFDREAREFDETTSGTTSGTTMGQEDRIPNPPASLPSVTPFVPLSAGGTLPGPRNSLTPAMSYLIDRFIDQADLDFQICRALPSQQERIEHNAQSYLQELESFISGTTPENAMVESSLIPVSSFIRLRQVAEILFRINTAWSTRSLTFVTESQFSSLRALAEAEMIANRDRFARLAQRSYHLYVLSRAALFNPQIANSETMIELCTRIETRAEQDAAGVTQSSAGATPSPSPSLEDEKTEVLRFLALIGMDPVSLGFDPNLENEVSANFGRNRVTFSVPWISKLFGVGFEVWIPQEGQSF